MSASRGHEPESKQGVSGDEPPPPKHVKQEQDNVEEWINRPLHSQAWRGGKWHESSEVGHRLINPADGLRIREYDACAAKIVGRDILENVQALFRNDAGERMTTTDQAQANAAIWQSAYQSEDNQRRTCYEDA